MVENFTRTSFESSSTSNAAERQLQLRLAESTPYNIGSRTINSATNLNTVRNAELPSITLYDSSERTNQLQLAAAEGFVLDEPQSGDSSAQRSEDVGGALGHRLVRDGRGRIESIQPQSENNLGISPPVKVGYSGDEITRLDFGSRGVLENRQGQWRLTNADGDRIQSVDGLPRLDPQKVRDVEIDQRTGVVTIHNHDDSTIIRKPDGSVIARNRDEKPTYILSAANISGVRRHSEITYDENGKVNSVKTHDGRRTREYKKGEGGVKDISVDRSNGTIYIDYEPNVLQVTVENVRNPQTDRDETIRDFVRRSTIAPDGKNTLEFRDGRRVVLDEGGGGAVLERPARGSGRGNAERLEIARELARVTQIVEEMDPPQNAPLSAALLGRIKSQFDQVTTKHGEAGAQQLQDEVNKKLKQDGSRYQINRKENGEISILVSN